MIPFRGRRLAAISRAEGASMEPLDRAPDWLLRPLPVNAAVDPALHAQLDTLAQGLPGSLDTLRDALSAVRAFHEYDAAPNRACALVWRSLDACAASPAVADRLALLNLASEHFT